MTELSFECPTLYRCTIDINTVNIPDRFLITAGQDTIADTKFLPCHSVAVYPCSHGFLLIQDSIAQTINYFPPDFMLTDIYGLNSSGRVIVTAPNNFTLTYIGNPYFPYTVASVAVKASPIRDTVYVDTTYTPCDDILVFSSGECIDTIFNYTLIKPPFIKDTTVCPGAVITLPEGDYEIDGMPIPTTIQVDETTQIDYLYSSGDCDSKIQFTIKVIEGPTDTILYFKKNQIIPYDTIDDKVLLPYEGCVFEVPFKRVYGVYIPNAFSPNGDGINDYFFVPEQPGIKEVKAIKIFDRWGGIILECTSCTWDGSGAHEGVYTVIVLYEDRYGDQVIYASDLTLLR